jgi:branched-chain amino acid transport system substrate-binding protein
MSRYRPKTMTVSASALMCYSLVALLSSVFLSACSSDDARAENPVVIGLLLPFTGPSSATASNFERAVIYATDRINGGGGVNGRALRVIARDTHSDLVRSRESAQALIDAGAVLVLGPEGSEIAAEIAPLLAAHQVALLSPLVGAANDAAVDCTHPWFRLAPSARSLGEALAKQLVMQGVVNAGVLYAAGVYNEALRDAVVSRFSELGGTVALTLELNPTAQSYAEVITRANAAEVEAIVLATSPRTGALVVNEFDALSRTPPHWFLSPLLKTELLLQNVAPAALEGAIGVAPRIYDQSSDFPEAFSQRWAGDRPLEGAYFYYDALGLVALALERAVLSADGKLEVEALESAILGAAAPPGESVGWNQIEVGLARARSGDNVYYSGLTGPMLLTSCGPRRLGVTSTWQVHGGVIENTEN